MKDNQFILEVTPLSKDKEIQDWKLHEETVERFIQVIAKNMTLYGVTPSIGRLYGVLYFSEDPMTLDDMSEALEMSKTSMSTGIRTLSEMNMVESTFKKGVRKDLYQPDEDWYKSFTSLFGNRWRQHTETNIEQADQAMRKLKQLQNTTNNKDLQEKIKMDINRLNDAKNYYKWLMEFIAVVESGDIFNYVPKIDSDE